MCTSKRGKHVHIFKPHHTHSGEEPDKRIVGRDFDQADWQKVAPAAVVLNDQREFVPQGLIDLSGQTTILEAIEILKHARGYIGIDSASSVLASQLFSGDNLKIKCVNPHGQKWQHIYFAPHTNIQF